jgi:oligopeptidase B
MPTDDPSPRPPVAAVHPHEVRSPNGTRIDEYYWLRDDARESPQVLDHLARENAYADAALAPHAALEKSLFAELTGRLAPEDMSVPVLDHGYWYYARYAKGSEHPVHARRRGSLDAPEEILLDANELARGLEYFEIGDYAVSPDGRRLAYTQDDRGRRQYELRVKDLATGALLADRIGNIEAELVWTADSGSLLYVEKDPTTLLSRRVRVHALGSADGADRILYEEPDDSFYVSIGRSRSERFAWVACSSTQQSEWHYADLADPALGLSCVLARTPDHEYDVEHLGEEFIVRSNWRAPNFRILRAPIASSADRGTWRDIVPHREDTLLERFEVGATHLVVNERREALRRIRVHPWTGAGDGSQDRVLDAPETAYAMGLVPTPGIESAALRFTYSSMTTPLETWNYELASGVRTLLKRESVLGGFDSANYRTDRRHAIASDGARVPVSLAWRSDTPLDGSAPVYQYGYGAYGHCIDPVFRPAWVSLLDRGFVVAIAHVRGGEDLGRSWYDGGRLLNKRNSFTDFIAVSEMLAREKLGDPQRICAQGGSAGGLLVGAVANMAPERYRAIVAYVPFVDVVTTMLDESLPLTTNEYDQWGDPRQQRSYDYMLSYSPYDNVRAAAYPAMLVFTGLWDSQVQYFEPAKWVARLRARKTDERPLLLCTDMGAGHGGKSGRFEHYHDTAREFAFLLWQVGKA